MIFFQNGSAIKHTKGGIANRKRKINNDEISQVSYC